MTVDDGNSRSEFGIEISTEGIAMSLSTDVTSVLSKYSLAEPLATYSQLIIITSDMVINMWSSGEPVGHLTKDSDQFVLSVRIVWGMKSFLKILFIYIFTFAMSQCGKLRLLVNWCIIIHTFQQITNDQLLI